MTDEELVKAAALAMGWREGEHRRRPYWYDGDMALISVREWNPLASDVDCWMLVDKLLESTWSLDIRAKGGTFKASFYCPNGPCKEHGNTSDRHGHGADCVDADRRRAIVLAALEAVGTPMTND